MAGDGVDGLVLRLPENILLVSGYWTQLGGMGLVFIPREGIPTLITPDYEKSEASSHWEGGIETFSLLLTHPPASQVIEEVLQRLATRHGVAGGTIGYEGSFEMLSPPSHAGEPSAVGLPTRHLIATACDSDHLIDMTNAIEDIRAVKSEQELNKLRTTNEIAMLGLEAFKQHARPGITEVELAAEVEGEIQRKGHGHNEARVVRAYAMVCSGPDTSVGWWSFRSRTRTVEANDVVMVELATVVDGYWSDHTRTVVAGRATSRQRAAFAAVRRGQEAGLNAARAGASGGEVDAAARLACSESGFTQFPHHTGHGLGFRYHESRPRIVPSSPDKLDVGMVIAIEPGVYEENLGGFRWEDNAVVTPDGAIRLADTRFELE